jgi:hypothetical protein
MCSFTRLDPENGVRGRVVGGGGLIHFLAESKGPRLPQPSKHRRDTRMTGLGLDNKIGQVLSWTIARTGPALDNRKDKSCPGQ